MSWTDERVALLTRLWNEGQSASQIAKTLGGVTRNAVIGKVHRLGLSKPSDASKSSEASAADAPAAEPQQPAEPASEAAAEQPVERPKPKLKVVTSTPPATEEAPKAKPEPEAEIEPEEQAAATDEADEADTDEPSVPALPSAPRTPQDFRALIAAGRPLPPQPSANEISAEALARVSEVERAAKRLSLLELTERTCKWPIGDPATEDFWFCGLPVQSGKPYCEAHVGVAFQPMSSRRDRRR